MKNLKPRDIVLLGLCSQSQFNAVVLDAVDEAASVKKTTKKK
jgi:hypothetical protein